MRRDLRNGRTVIYYVHITTFIIQLLQIARISRAVCFVFLLLLLTYSMTLRPIRRRVVILVYHHRHRSPPLPRAVSLAVPGLLSWRYIRAVYRRYLFSRPAIFGLIERAQKNPRSLAKTEGRKKKSPFLPPQLSVRLLNRGSRQSCSRLIARIYGFSFSRSWLPQASSPSCMRCVSRRVYTWQLFPRLPLSFFSFLLFGETRCGRREKA